MARKTRRPLDQHAVILDSAKMLEHSVHLLVMAAKARNYGGVLEHLDDLTSYQIDDLRSEIENLETEQETN